MKVPPAVFSCKTCTKNKHNLFSHKIEVNFKRKKKYKRKDFIPKKEMDKTRRKKANTEKIGKIIFWFTDNS